MNKIEPRYYQHDALNALLEFFQTLKPGVRANPCLKLPPGTGKSIIVAMAVKELFERWNARILILCHSSELIDQDYRKTVEFWPEGEHLFGINAEKLGRRDYDNQIIFATIQSVYNNPALFFANNKQPYNVVLTDECQRIPPDGDGMYLSFFNRLLEYNPDTRIGGLTASDWRLGSGRICKPGNILTHLIYEYPIMEAIQKGYLAKPVNNPTKHRIDRSKLKIQRGDFTEESMNKVMNQGGLIADQIEEVIRTAEREEREYWLFNCIGIPHANAVYERLEQRGIVSDVIHSDIEDAHRKDIMSAFREKETNALVHVNMISLGVDFPHLSLGALMRPTKSSELYYQQIGRIIRVEPFPCPKCGKKSIEIEDNCQYCGGLLSRTFAQMTGYIMDFAGNVAEHGAINCDLASPDKGKKQKKGPRLKECPNCREAVAIHLKQCPYCDSLFPRQERENNTFSQAQHGEIIAEPEWMDVENHQFFTSAKKGIIQHHLFLKGDIKITNRLELESEDPLKREKARKFLQFLLNEDVPKTVRSFVEDGYREKINCPSQVLVTQQAGFRRLEEYRYNNPYRGEQ